MSGERVLVRQRGYDPLRTHVSSASASPSSPARRAGRVLSGLAAAFLVADGIAKCLNPLPPPIVETLTQLGYSTALAPAIGGMALLGTALYLLPRTSFVGALLLTGFLGGAVATHVRVASPLFSHILFPVYVAVLVWGGLYLRDGRLRALLRRP